MLIRWPPGTEECTPVCSTSLRDLQTVAADDMIPATYARAPYLSRLAVGPYETACCSGATIALAIASCTSTATARKT